MFRKIFLMLILISYITFSFANSIKTSYIDAHEKEKTIKDLIKLVTSDNPREYVEAVGDLEYLLWKGKKEIFTISALREAAIPVLIKDLEDTEWGKIFDPEHEVVLIEILGEFRDPRAIPAMMKSLRWVGLRADPFAKMGPVILDPLIKKLSDKKARYRALVYLGGVMEIMPQYGYSISEEDKKRVKEELVKVLKGESLKLTAIEALGKMAFLYEYSEYEDIIPLLEKIARTDPFYREKIDKAGRKIGRYYPVREEAQELLKQLEAKKKEK